MQPGMFPLNNKTFNDYFNLKRSQGNNHYAALGHVAHKLVRIIFKMPIFRLSKFLSVGIIFLLTIHSWLPLKRKHFYFCSSSSRHFESSIGMSCIFIAEAERQLGFVSGIHGSSHEEIYIRRFLNQHSSHPGRPVLFAPPLRHNGCSYPGSPVHIPTPQAGGYGYHTPPSPGPHLQSWVWEEYPDPHRRTQ